MNHDFAQVISALLIASLVLVAPDAGATQTTLPVPCDEVLLALDYECICY